MLKTLAVVATLAFAAKVHAEAPRLKPKDVRQGVFVVRPHYHENTRQMFRELAQLMNDLARSARDEDAAAGFRGLGGQYAAHAESPGHGTGWLVVDADGASWVVTNKHVAGQAYDVALESPQRKAATLPKCLVTYVDPLFDLAIIEIPQGELPAGTQGFQLSDERLEEGGSVVAIGFPGVGSKPVYQYTNGIVNNAEFPGAGGPVIQHSATIDPGNSGGPLLVEDRRAPLGYRVVGVNTWKLQGRTNVNLAIPARAVSAALEQARKFRKLRSTPDLLQAELLKTAERLEEELGKAKLDRETLYPMISYPLVAQHGSKIILPLLKNVRGLSPEEQQLLIADPVEFLRHALYELFVVAFHPARIADVHLEKVYSADFAKVAAAGSAVGSVYAISGKNQEFKWSFGPTGWSISDASWDQSPVVEQTSAPVAKASLVTAAPQPREPPPQLPAEPASSERSARFGAKVGLNASNFSGSDASFTSFDTRTSLTVGAYAHVPIHQLFAIHVEGLYSPKGAVLHDVDLGEVTLDITYIDVPVMLAFDVPTHSNLEVSLLGGIYGAFKTGANVSAAGGSVSLDALGLSAKGVDVGLVVGADIGFRTGKLTLLAGARYERGLGSALEQLDLANSVFTIFGGLSF